jgi:hypothetical protein
MNTQMIENRDQQIATRRALRAARFAARRWYADVQAHAAATGAERRKLARAVRSSLDAWMKADAIVWQIVDMPVAS